VRVAAIVHSIEITRPPEEVFAYLDDLSRHNEWQEQIVSVRVDSDGPTSVGTRATETRRAGGREQTLTYEVTEHDPPRLFGFHGVDGPIRPVGRGIVEPVGGGQRSKITLELDFEGHGFGKLLRPLVLWQARKQVPKDHERLKQQLESGPASQS
jgi:uncharacterized membrane protein